MQTFTTWCWNRKWLLIIAMLLLLLLTDIVKASDLNSFHLNNLELSIINHEGISPFAYHDTEGNITVGIGKNIDRRSQLGLSTHGMVFLMREDIQECQEELVRYNWYNTLNQPRKDTLTELCYNIGVPKILQFKKMIKAIEKKDFDKASYELLDSKWRTQVGKRRSMDMSEQLKTGKYS